MPRHEATVEITVRRPIFIDTFANCKEVGRIMLREAGRTIACGVVTKIYDDIIVAESNDDAAAASSSGPAFA